MGCSYCVMMCPYDVPMYSPRLGIVRKCDLCHGRLAAGEAPACVQACPNAAIRVRSVSRQDLLRQWRPSKGAPPSPTFLPSSPSPSLTIPTTRFVTRRLQISGARAANDALVCPALPHHPLVGFLVLSQFSVGLSLTAAAAMWKTTGVPFPSGNAQAGMWAAGWLLLIALALAFLHLGRPLRAWRAFLGWRTSWFSREMIFFGLYAAGFAAWEASPRRGSTAAVIATATATAGLMAVGCSAWIYAATRRTWWSLGPTAVRFLGTTFALGASGAGALGLQSPGGPVILAGLAGLAMSAVVGVESVQRKRGRREGAGELHRTVLLLAGPLRWKHRARWMAAVTGMVILLMVVALPSRASILFTAGACVGLVSGILERHLFFTAVSQDRMPGGIADP